MNGNFTDEVEYDFENYLADGCHIDCNGVVEARSIVPAMVKVKSCTVFSREDSEQLIKKMGGVIKVEGSRIVVREIKYKGGEQV